MYGIADAPDAMGFPRGRDRGDENFRWYAVYTYPRHEKKVLSALEERGIESMLPLYQVIHRWRNGVKRQLSLPLFPGYVFVHFNVQQKLKILSIPSVASLVGCGAEPSPLQDGEVDAIRLALPHLAKPHPFLKCGDRVRLKSGPLAGLEGILLRKKDSMKFVLSMDLLQQAISVEIDPADLEQSAVESRSAA